jgi:hypothetical protein
MADQDIAQQSIVENEMLNHIMGSLRLTMAWKVEGNDFSRKLSTMRFITHSLVRHLEHMFALEEYDGYMDVVGKLSPHLARRVDALRRDHDQFRTTLHRFIPRLERASTADLAEFDKLCQELLGLLDRLDAHGRTEAKLIQESFGRDGGGEG